VKRHNAALNQIPKGHNKSHYNVLYTHFPQTYPQFLCTAGVDKFKKCLKSHILGIIDEFQKKYFIADV